MGRGGGVGWRGGTMNPDTHTRTHLIREQVAGLFLKHPADCGTLDLALQGVVRGRLLQRNHCAASKVEHGSKVSATWEW